MNNNIPNVLRETSNGYQMYSIASDMLMRREVECQGTIDTDSATALIRQLRFLEKEDDAKEITVIISSPGGEVDAGLAVYDVIKGLKCPVRTVCVGLAASIASVLFSAGDTRQILPHSKVMIHDPSIVGSLGGSALAIQEISSRLLESRKIICSILADCSGHTLNEIMKRTSKDTYFTSKEAVSFGLADEIIEHI